MPDIQDPRLLWAVSSLLIVVLGFFIKSWMNRISEDFRAVLKKLDCKQDRSVCNERYPNLRKDSDNFYRHKHALNCSKDETGGVVIP